MDPRLIAADDWHRKRRWIQRQLDDLARQGSYCFEMEQRLRDEVAAEREAREHQREADAELVASHSARRSGRKARAV